jgi:hypothetical protein
MGILSKSTIETWILPHLTAVERGFETTVPLTEILEAILHRLKTGGENYLQKSFFSEKILSGQSLFYY